MVKASLNLESFKQKGITGEMAVNFAQDWKSIPHIYKWLRIRGFNVECPIMVSEEKGQLIFFQKPNSTPKTILIIHPDVEYKESLVKAMKEAGHSPYAFATTEEAIKHVSLLKNYEITVDLFILPQDLKTSSNILAALLLKRLFPSVKVKEVAPLPKGESEEELEARKKDLKDQTQAIRSDRFFKNIKLGQDVDFKTKTFLERNYSAFQEVFTATNPGYRVTLWTNLIELSKRESVAQDDMRLIWKRSRNIL